MPEGDPDWSDEDGLPDEQRQQDEANTPAEDEEDE